jgi:membrane protease YdiL (CAAX protease family)
VIPVRLGFWVLLVGAVAALNYAAYGTAQSNGEEIYQWSSFANGAVFYAVVLGLTLLLAIERRDLLALRRPSVSLSLGARVAGGAILAILVWEWVVVQLPVEDPGKEQGLTPTQWEPKHAAAFTANVLLFVVLAPFVEELLFRGLGQSLLRATTGAVPAVLVVGLAFGAWHGLLWALLVLVPFGWALAFVRERTDSVYPGMIVHALFNAFAIAASVLS